MFIKVQKLDTLFAQKYLPNARFQSFYDCWNIYMLQNFEQPLPTQAYARYSTQFCQIFDKVIDQNIKQPKHGVYLQSTTGSVFSTFLKMDITKFTINSEKQMKRQYYKKLLPLPPKGMIIIFLNFWGTELPFLAVDSQVRG